MFDLRVVLHIIGIIETYYIFTNKWRKIAIATVEILCSVENVYVGDGVV